MRVIMSLNGISIQLGLVCLYSQVIFLVCILLSSLSAMRLQILFILSTFLVPCIVGWGGGIHREITRLATRELHSKGKKFVRDHFPGGLEELIGSSSWADSDEAINRYPGSDDEHFSHTPFQDCQPFVFERDCGFDQSGVCVVSGIADWAMRAIDRSASVEDRMDAIKFLVHLVADIHQPLHTGFAQDSGGGNIGVLFRDSSLSLHQMWDYGIWETDLADRLTEVHEPISIQFKGSSVSHESFIKFASRIATESSLRYTCDFAYMNESTQFVRNGERLTDQYMISRKAIIRERMATAALRLGEVLNVLGKHFADKPNTRTAVVSRRPVQRPNNRYAELDVEFEPDIVIDQLSTTALVAVSDTTTPIPSSSPQASTVTDEDSILDEFAANAKPDLLDGFDMSTLTLTNSDGQYVITTRDRVLAGSGIFARVGYAFRFKFVRNRRRREPVMFFVDREAFGERFPQIRPHHVAAVLLYLRGIRGSEAHELLSRFGRMNVFEQIIPLSNQIESTSTKGWCPFDNKTDPNGVIYSLTMQFAISTETYLSDIGGNLRFPTLGAKSEFDFFTKLSEIAVYIVSRTVVFVHQSTLTASPPLKYMRFNWYDGLDLNMNPLSMLIDPVIFDGDATDKISRGIESLLKRPNGIELGLRLQYTRPSFISEIEDINAYFAARGRREFEVIQFFLELPLVFQTMKPVVWSLDRVTSYAHHRQDTLN